MNIINKLHILKDTAVFTSEKLSQKFWCDLFHALERTIITSEDEKKIASAQNFLAKHWRKIHAAGIDLAEIVKVMNPMDVIDHSRNLTKLTSNSILIELLVWLTEKLIPKIYIDFIL